MPLFPTTRRSVVQGLASADAHERTRAFDTLVAIYWKPLYKHARLSWSRSPEDAEDLTQAFFARMYERESLFGFDASKAAFRTYLRTLFERYAMNENKAASRVKRGGGAVALDFDDAEAELATVNTAASPEDLFYRDWVRSVFHVAISRLRESVSEEQFAVFEAYDLGDDNSISYRQLAARFGIRETTVTNHLSAARRRFREAILDTLRDATASDQEFRSEARALLGIEE
ncbi:MAG TPA: sigma-70 family RNA polymerase sigma factor [Thermoanaerobaculia bacterium]|nr:sigma-70 family RNA polymerase sigma factor [Thermoanaerobaculia bacterium]